MQNKNIVYKRWISTTDLYETIKALGSDKGATCFEQT